MQAPALMLAYRAHRSGDRSPTARLLYVHQQRSARVLRGEPMPTSLLGGFLCHLGVLLSLHCGVGGSLSFNDTHGSFMVLQQAPAKAAVYGTVAEAEGDVQVSVTSIGQDTYTVKATTQNGRWLAYLKPTAAGGDYTITATAASGTEVNITNVTYGDVYYCAGEAARIVQSVAHPAFACKLMLNVTSRGRPKQHGPAACEHDCEPGQCEKDLGRWLPEHSHSSNEQQHERQSALVHAV